MANLCKSSHSNAPKFETPRTAPADMHVHSSSPELSLEITHNLVQPQGNILKNVIFAPFSNFVQNLGDKCFPYLAHSLRYVSTA